MYKIICGWAILTLLFFTWAANSMPLPVPIVPIDYKGTDQVQAKYSDTEPESIDEDEWICLSLVIFGESRSDTDSQYGVAHVVVNRVKDSRNSGVYADTVCATILRANQFEPITGELREVAIKAQQGHHVYPRLTNKIEAQAWIKSMSVAYDVLYGNHVDPTAGATHFYAPSTQQKKGRHTPRWVKALKPTVTLGKHKFYIDYYSGMTKVGYYTSTSPYVR